MRITPEVVIDRRRIGDALIRAARKLTAQRGLDDLSVDELCTSAPACPRAEAASLILGRLVSGSALDVVRCDADGSFAGVLRRRGAAAQAFFATRTTSAPRP